MAETHPVLSFLRYKWGLGFNGWHTENDANLVGLGALLQLAVKSRTTSLPGSPANGDRYIVPTGDPNAGQVAARIEGAWVYYPPAEGWTAWVEDEGIGYRHMSGTWTAVPDLPKSNFSGTTAPDVNDDTTQGYSAGSKWYNTTASPAEVYLCVNPAAGAAVWELVTFTVDELGALALLNTIGTGQLDDEAVTLQKLQQISGARVLGRPAGSDGAVQELDLEGILSILSPVNDIGVPGQRGFGVGICPDSLPAGMVELSGTRDITSDNYGNYQYSDGSIMVWVPAFYYKVGTGANGVAVNDVDIQPLDAYADVATANADGYALHRAFYDGGAEKSGVFVDKFLCSNNGGVASSIQLGDPLSSSGAHNPFGGLTGAPANNYFGAIDAAKTRGSDFFCNSLFVFKALAMLSLAHANASSSTTWCAWYHATDNFPKGCNNNALGDHNDADLAFVSDGYSNAAKTGSANLFARTTHNGQGCGIADLNGCMWEITPGLTMDGSTTADNLYVLATSTAMKDVTSGNSAATDLWGASGLAALYDDLGAMSSFTSTALNFTDRTIDMGSASQVLSESVSGTLWQMAGAGVPLVSGGSNQFGNDRVWDYSTNELCPLCGGSWVFAAGAGVWSLNLSFARSDSTVSVGFRAALYL